MSTKLRVTFFSFGILEQGGGFENYVVATARGLADRYQDLDIRIVTMSPKIVERLQWFLSVYFMKKQSAEHIYREDIATITSKLGRVTYSRADSLAELRLILKKSDVLYSKNEVLELATLHILGIKKLPPILMGVHTPIYYPYTPSLSAKLHNLIYVGPIYRFMIRHISSIQVHNIDDLNIVKTKLHYANVKLVKQAFDTLPLAVKKNTSNVFRLLFVGRLTEAKGIDLLVDIVKNLNASYAGKYELRVAGSGDDSTVHQMIMLAKNDQSVTYLGHVPNEKIATLYDWTDVTLIPSKYETLNKVAIETAQAGKIALCTDIPGPREVIRDGQTGFLIEADSQAFAERIKKLATLKAADQDGFYQIGTSAHDYIKQKFDPQSSYEELRRDFIGAAQKV